ncbi:MutS-related protein [Granulicella tundricola]|uniref:DNA mismatch repair protein MutS domain protein n=1 Tax=Granulicella tundricola (strain ATCC BAA-1859 / DSM 23138 / MP5ACTX9) TaxID=1198114 RepID=E8WXV4_GRATM|nr:DNA mismatch repair protein MutS [Granulicella tundricola]ADW69799.1 DNA mismatch repair protein MutS domain protein [Granulicella tundricola MP5ACTX9]
MQNSSLSPHANNRPQTQGEVEAHYIELRKQHQTRQDGFAARKTRIGWALIVCLGIIVALATQAHHQTSPWPLLAAFAVLASLVPVHLGLQTRISRTERLLGLYDRNLARVRSEAWQSGNTGETLHQPGHLYERDLNLLGEDSLFGLLDTVRTGIGQRGLADYLQAPAIHAETLERQQAVKELAAKTELREEIALLGTSKFQQVEARFFDTWLDEEAPVFHPAFRYVLVVTALALVVMLLLGLTHAVAWPVLLPNLALAAVLQAGISMSLRSRVLPLLERVTRLSNHVQMFSDGLAILETQSFQALKLQAIQAAARQPANAVPLLAKLQSQITIVQQRTKEYFFIFSLLLAAGTQAAITIAAWKRANGAAMKSWLAAWAEFEALNALAAYAFEHPEDAWPELLPASAQPTFEAIELGHPLLTACVRNDVSLGDATRFFLISGSNMSGKSTLMRSIGINAVLAYAGAPVRAHSMQLTPLTLGASLALTDSLAEGKSKFLAEVERLQKIVQTSAGSPVLFLVDEIFSGTNSVDRQAAAGAVLRSLLVNGAIGALSTHDLALAELANEENCGLNVHMASPDPEDPLGFDYRLKPGVNTSSNALAIIRMMGL